MTNGPIEAMSDGGASGAQLLANVPAAIAAWSLCFGMIATRSRIRMPGPNGTAEETTTVRASGAVTVRGLPPTVSADTSGLPVRGSYSASNVKTTSADVN